MKAIITILFVAALVVGCRSESPSPASNQATQAPNATTPDKTDRQDVRVVAEAPAPPQSSPWSGDIPVCKDSVLPGTSITRKGAPLNLEGTPVKVGDPLPDINLTDAANGKTVHTGALKGKVLLISVVPAVETPVCSVQSHYLETAGDRLGDKIIRITVSRNSAAQLQDFARTAVQSHVMYLSDREFNTFGTNTGLGVQGADTLARSVMVVDRNGIIQYLQVVPEITQLPDMNRAFQVARELAVQE